MCIPWKEHGPARGLRGFAKGKAVPVTFHRDLLNQSAVFELVPRRPKLASKFY
jgi:hypothetical protein